MQSQHSMGRTKADAEPIKTDPQGVLAALAILTRPH